MMMDAMTMETYRMLLECMFFFFDDHETLNFNGFFQIRDR